MSERRPLVSGDVLAGRYELQDLVSEHLGTATWRAHDQILSRNVGIEMLPSNDPRADHFVAAARESTIVTDPRFLRVMDLVENDHQHHLVVREWARAFPLDQLLAQSPLPNRRAATVVAEVAEALAHAHEQGVYHRRLNPHHVLLKQSGAVRIVGLGVASALAPVGHQDTLDDLQHYEQLDVQALGKLLYAALVSRWPYGQVDGLRTAPTEHGRLLRPRQVRAGVARDVDNVCDRILGNPPRHHAEPLRKAADIAAVLRLAGEDEDLQDEEPSVVGSFSPDLLRLDPVITPAGPPPGLEPPRRRPKAFEPKPPTPFEKGKERAIQSAKGDRLLIWLGVIGVIALVGVMAFLVGRATISEHGSISRTANTRLLPIHDAKDFDPFGDGSESPETVAHVADGDPETSWQTSTYFNNPALGGLKSGVGVLLDLGGLREVDDIRVLLTGTPTDLAIYATDASQQKTPVKFGDFRRVTQLTNASSDVSLGLNPGVRSRYLLVWLEKLPEIEPGKFRGEIREVSVQGRS